MKKRNLLGKRFGKLLVVSESATRSDGQICWVCRCDCGKTTQPIPSGNLTRGHTKSCGCLKEKHGMYYTHLYWVWSGMKKRCESPKHPAFKNYGGRGIQVCKEWKQDFRAFADMKTQQNNRRNNVCRTHNMD